SPHALVPGIPIGQGKELYIVAHFGKKGGSSPKFGITIIGMCANGYDIKYFFFLCVRKSERKEEADRQGQFSHCFSVYINDVSAIEFLVTFCGQPLFSVCAPYPAGVSP